MFQWWTENHGINKADEFNDRPARWRIEAVIHDGSWFDIKKWAKIAKVSIEEIEEWIKEHLANGKLIQSDNGVSYRVNYDQIIAWYESQPDIELVDQIVPNQYPPKLWVGITETEGFLLAPRRKVSTATIVADGDLLKKVQNALKGIALVRKDKLGKYKCYGKSPAFIKSILKDELTPIEFELLDFKARSNLYKREISDLPDGFMSEAIKFYYPYARNALRKSEETLGIFLKEREDVVAQVVDWIVRAVEKFDDTEAVPFPGYFTKVLRHWPYDLPNDVLGKELSAFQRERSKVIAKLKIDEEDKSAILPIEILATHLGMSVDEYMSLEERHQVWKNSGTATSLVWDDSASCKAGESYMHERTNSTRCIETLNRISHATIEAALDSLDFTDAYVLIDLIDKNVLNLEKIDLSEQFKTAFAKNLGMKY